MLSDTKPFLTSGHTLDIVGFFFSNLNQIWYIMDLITLGDTDGFIITPTELYPQDDTRQRNYQNKWWWLGEAMVKNIIVMGTSDDDRNYKPC